MSRRMERYATKVHVFRNVAYYTKYNLNHTQERSIFSVSDRIKSYVTNREAYIVADLQHLYS